MHLWVCELRVILATSPVSFLQEPRHQPGASDLSVRIRLIPMSPLPLLPGVTPVAAPPPHHTPKSLSLPPLKLKAHGITHLTDAYGEFSLLCWDLAPRLGQELHEGRDVTFSPNSGPIIRAPAHTRDALRGPGLG